MKRSFALVAICLLSVQVASAEIKLRLKNAPPGFGTEGISGRSPSPKSRSFNRIHALATFEQGLTRRQILDLEQSSIRFVQFVPDNSYVLSIDLQAPPDLAGLRSLRLFQTQEKISPALKTRGVPFPALEYFVAEFHADVDPESVREIAMAEGFEVHENANLLTNHLLILGPRDAVPSLASWDEVAYVFPASGDLAAGKRVEACPGALTDLGAIGQNVATIGEGWDGDGRGTAELGYFFRRLTNQLPADQVRREIARSFVEWARAAAVSFQPAAGPDQPRKLDILFAPGNHGDAYPFDGPGHVLAHTYYPAPPNPEPVAGDIHLDDEEEWVAGPDLTVRSVDIYSVVLHELGHALGLGHSDVPGSVMYPYYRRLTALTAEDILAIQELYASPGEAPSQPPGQPAVLTLSIASPPVFPVTTTASAVSISGTVTGGTGDVVVTWANDRSGAGLAVGGRTWAVANLPLYPGDNNITLTATDSVSTQISRTVLIVREDNYQPPSVSILSPTTSATFAATSATITLGGTAASASGIVRIEWSNSRGGGGTASGTAQWKAGPVALQAGANLITVKALDSQGASAYRTLNVTYSSGVDPVAPTLKITSPSSTSVATSATAIQVKGTATDNVGVAAVTWTTSFNKSGVAAGTANWNTGDIPLVIGTNTVVVRARDAAGNTAWRSVTVTRR